MHSCEIHLIFQLDTELRHYSQHVNACDDKYGTMNDTSRAKIK